MDLQRLPFRAPLADYERQAETIQDRLALARSYDFLDWAALETYVAAVTQDGPVYEFEAAVEAVIHGDLAALQDALRRDPGLVHARSTRLCCFDPPAHRATLLHYVAANGVEGYRQMTPPNAVEIARALLAAGAVPDSLAHLYGGQWTTLGLLVSSIHPAKAGLQVPLIDLLLDFGAGLDREDPKWGTPLHVALTFGMRDAAQALVRRGARIDLPAAAGLGLFQETARLLPAAAPLARHQALALAAQHGHAEVVRLLLDAGEDPNRFNPEGHHAHSTPLHQAVAGGHEETVRLLIARGACTGLRDSNWHGTPLDWAEYCRQPSIAAYLRGLEPAA
jgi:hypothetical protein